MPYFCFLQKSLFCGANLLALLKPPVDEVPIPSYECNKKKINRVPGQ